DFNKPRIPRGRRLQFRQLGTRGGRSRFKRSNSSTMQVGKQQEMALTNSLNLNARAAKLCDHMVADASRLRIAASQSSCGARLIDCGVAAVGGLEAGLRLAEVCLSGLASVSIQRAAEEFGTLLAVHTTTDHPLLACMASQYAGWQISAGKFFAMGSG